MTAVEKKPGLEVLGPVTAEQAEILSPDALDFFAQIHREFNPRRLELLGQREQRQEALDRGEMPRFLPETQSIRDTDWKVSPVSDC